MLTTELFYTGLYYFFAVVAVGSAGVVAFSRNLAHAIFMLLFALGSVAAFYALLGADFLFAAQILIYVGGILVILIFAMMISEHFPVEGEERPIDKSLSAGIISLLFLAIMTGVAWATRWPESISFSTEPTTSSLALSILTKFLLPFELAGVLLLVALMAATLLIRKEDEEPHPNIEYERERDQE